MDFNSFFFFDFQAFEWVLPYQVSLSRNLTYIKKNFSMTPGRNVDILDT
jgi:hypothetical protein